MSTPQLNKNAATTITASGIRDAVTDDPIDDATVTFTVKRALTDEELPLWDKLGGPDTDDMTAVSGAEDIEMEYNDDSDIVSSHSDAQYTGELPAAVGRELILGQYHPVVVTVDGSDKTRLYVVAYDRGENAP